MQQLINSKNMGTIVVLFIVQILAYGTMVVKYYKYLQDTNFLTTAILFLLMTFTIQYIAIFYVLVPQSLTNSLQMDYQLDVKNQDQGLKGVTKIKRSSQQDRDYYLEKKFDCFTDNSQKSSEVQEQFSRKNGDINSKILDGRMTNNYSLYDQGLHPRQMLASIKRNIVDEEFTNLHDYTDDLKAHLDENYNNSIEEISASYPDFQEWMQMDNSTLIEDSMEQNTFEDNLPINQQQELFNGFRLIDYSKYKQQHIYEQLEDLQMDDKRNQFQNAEVEGEETADDIQRRQIINHSNLNPKLFYDTDQSKQELYQELYQEYLQDAELRLGAFQKNLQRVSRNTILSIKVMKAGLKEIFPSLSYGILGRYHQDGKHQDIFPVIFNEHSKQAPPKFNIPVGIGSLCFHVANKCVSIFIRNCGQHDRYFTDTYYMKLYLNLHSVCCCPILTNDVLEGYLLVGFETPQEWSNIQKEVMISFTNIIGLNELEVLNTQTRYERTFDDYPTSDQVQSGLRSKKNLNQFQKQWSSQYNEQGQLQQQIQNNDVYSQSTQLPEQNYHQQSGDDVEFLTNQQILQNNQVDRGYTENDSQRHADYKSRKFQDNYFNQVPAEVNKLSEYNFNTQNDLQDGQPLDQDKAQKGGFQRAQDMQQDEDTCSEHQTRGDQGAPINFFRGTFSDNDSESQLQDLHQNPLPIIKEELNSYACSNLQASTKSKDMSNSQLPQRQGKVAKGQPQSDRAGSHLEEAISQKRDQKLQNRNSSDYKLTGTNKERRKSTSRDQGTAKGAGDQKNLTQRLTQTALQQQGFKKFKQKVKSKRNSVSLRSEETSFNDQSRREVFRDPRKNGELVIQAIIGRGGFGNVYKGIWRNNVVAIKVMQLGDEFQGFDDDLSDSNDSQNNAVTSGQRAALLEGAMMRSIKHPNIVRTYDYCIMDNQEVTQQLMVIPRQSQLTQTYIIMEFCDQGSLSEAIDEGIFLGQPQPVQVQRKQRHKANTKKEEAEAAQSINVEFLLMTLLDICRAMAYLHKVGIMHRDLKPKNILLKTNATDKRGFIVKVSDFGLSQFQVDQNVTHLSTRYSGTVTHMPPELLEEGRVYPAGDVYAFAIIAWELFTQQPPYKDLSRPQIVVGVVSHDLRPTLPLNMPPWFKDLLQQSWNKDPHKRPRFSTIEAKLEDMLRCRGWEENRWSDKNFGAINNIDLPNQHKSNNMALNQNILQVPTTFDKKRP